MGAYLDYVRSQVPWAKDLDDLTFVKRVAEVTGRSINDAAKELGVETGASRSIMGAGLSSGWEDLKGLGKSAAAWGTGALGLEDHRDYWTNSSEKNQIQSQIEGRPELERVEDIDGVGGAFDWAKYQVAKQVPNLTAAIGMGLATPAVAVPTILSRGAAMLPRAIGGGGMGSRVAAAGAEAAAKGIPTGAAKFGAQRAALETGQTFGKQVVGGLAFNEGQAIGSLYQEAVDAGRPDAYGETFAKSIPYAVSETLPEAMLVGRFKGGSGFNGNFLTRAGKSALVQGAAGATSEGAQNELETSMHPEGSLSPEEIASRRLNSIVAGGTVEGVFGLLGGGTRGRQRGLRDPAALADKSQETSLIIPPKIIPPAASGATPYVDPDLEMPASERAFLSGLLEEELAARGRGTQIPAPPGTIPGDAELRSGAPRAPVMPVVPTAPAVVDKKAVAPAATAEPEVPTPQQEFANVVRTALQRLDPVKGVHENSVRQKVAMWGGGESSSEAIHKHMRDVVVPAALDHFGVSPSFKIKRAAEEAVAVLLEMEGKPPIAFSPSDQGAGLTTYKMMRQGEDAEAAAQLKKLQAEGRAPAALATPTAGRTIAETGGYDVNDGRKRIIRVQDETPNVEPVEVKADELGEPVKTRKKTAPGGKGTAAVTADESENTGKRVVKGKQPVAAQEQEDAAETVAFLADEEDKKTTDEVEAGHEESEADAEETTSGAVQAGLKVYDAGHGGSSDTTTANRGHIRVSAAIDKGGDLNARNSKSGKHNISDPALHNYYITESEKESPNEDGLDTVKAAIAERRSTAEKEVTASDVGEWYEQRAVEKLAKKRTKNAVQKPSAKEVDAQEPPGDGQGVGEPDTGEQQPTGQSDQAAEATEAAEGVPKAAEASKVVAPRPIEAQYAAVPVDFAQKHTVMMEFFDEEQGKYINQAIPARNAVQTLKQDKATLEKLLKCVKTGGT